MLLYSFFLLITISALVAFADWRRGIFMMVLIAAIQDPVRKLIPGTPSYLVLATLPVWFLIVVSLFVRIPRLLAIFRKSHRHLSSSMKIFMVALIPGALLSVSYGPGSWRYTLLGLLAYGGILTGWLIGFIYARGERDVTRLMAFYSLVTAIILTGTYIEHMGLAPAWSALGTEVFGSRWIRYTDYGPVPLYSGFYRSPDVMGWHAVVAGMCSLMMGIRERRSKRLFWFLISAWAIGAAMVCGRRKMIMMLPLFGMILSWIYWRAKSTSRAVTIAGTIILVFVAGYIIYNQFAEDQGIEYYYIKYLGDAPLRVKSHGIDSVIETFRQSGFFGEGLGFAVQGSQYVTADKPRVWQEGGLEKILVELGVPGFLAFILIATALFHAILRIVLHQISPGSPDFSIYAGLAAIVLANAGSFIVSHQVYGDFFIMTYFSFLTGMLLSAARAKQNLNFPEKGAIPGFGGGKYQAGATVRRTQFSSRGRR